MTKETLQSLAEIYNTLYQLPVFGDSLFPYAACLTSFRRIINDAVTQFSDGSTEVLPECETKLEKQ